MEKVIKKWSSPGFLNGHWDELADSYFQKREFLELLHKYNPCAQRYYELYCDGTLVAGTIVYTLKIDLFTFSRIPSPFKVQVIGLPVSVASPPIIGVPEEFGYLLSEILKIEKGVILGINFKEDYLQDSVLNLRTLPTILLELPGNNMAAYENALRHCYRRRLRLIREKFSGVTSVTSGCSEFSEEHYSLYLQIMKKTTTKLEILNRDVFRNLPSNFRITTYYSDQVMLAWYVVCQDNDTLFFFFGGMNYELRDRFQSYNNNLLGIIEDAFGSQSRIIDFGQTAEIAKTRFGGVLSERRMFFYHRNRIIFGLLKLSRKLIEYSRVSENPRVFRSVN
ncbi:MAG: hypothetical protein FD166_1261 [Bacteroidetes bacterium]|nr:MAG: hypothetical protein FD166_1261 [Bacteroidota bacterium]